MTVPEVMYAIRRSDGDEMGDYKFTITCGSDDWEAAEADSDGADEACEYEMLKMTVEVVARRTLPCCRECDAPATHWGLCEKHAREDDPDAFDDETGQATEGAEDGG